MDREPAVPDRLDAPQGCKWLVDPYEVCSSEDCISPGIWWRGLNLNR